MSAAERSEPSFDAYASKVLDPDGAAPLDPCGCTVSGSYRRPQGVVMPRPIRASAAIDWLANQNPLSVVEWADPVVEAAGHPVQLGRASCRERVCQYV